MSASRRIAINTIATYGRSVIAMALGLFGSRWILQSLGETDFGLYGVVGSIILFITFFNCVSSGAVARFFSYSIGKGNYHETKQWFNTALLLHTVIPITLILLGWPAGEWAVRNFLNIPAERLHSCLLVFRFSLVSAFVSMASTPYIGMLTAKQRIAEIAFWNTLSAVACFVLAFSMTKYSGDVLVAFSLGMVAIRVATQLTQAVRARCLYKECSIVFSECFDKVRLKEILSFTGWSLWGSLGFLFRSQGIGILLNKYFNPVSFPSVNASYSVGNMVATHTQTFSAALLGAFVPEITATEGRGDRTKMLTQALCVSKLSACLIMLFTVPLVFEINYVLELWLKKPPVLAAAFCQLMLISFIVENCSIGLMVAVGAAGKIARYQVTLGSVTMSTVLVGWLLLGVGFGPVSVGFAYLFTTTVCSLGRVFWAKRILDMPVRAWVTGVALPCFGVFVFSSCIGYFIHNIDMPIPFIRLVCVTSVTIICNVIGMWYVVLNKQEKTFINTNLRKILCRIGFSKTVEISNDQ